MEAPDETPGRYNFVPYDYVELTTGDLACLAWSQDEEEVWSAVVFYAGREVPDARRVMFDSGPFWKLLIGKDVSTVRSYTRGLSGVNVVNDPVGGLMVQIRATDVVRHHSGRRHVDLALDDDSLSRVLLLLGVSASSAGVSGSTLLGKADPEDLDLVIYSPVVGQAVAATIRQILADDRQAWLKGYWGRSHHHRRFRIGDLNVCTKFPLPAMPVRPWDHARYVGEGRAVSAIVTSAEWGHCSPAFYRVRFVDDSNGIPGGEEVSIYSSESAHSMAFAVGDSVTLDGFGLYERDGCYFATVSMCQVDAMRPRPQ